MTNDVFERGLEIRKSVLGKEFVEKSINSADDFNRPMQELVTEYCWGAVWGREGLSKKTRSMLNLAMLCIGGDPHDGPMPMDYFTWVAISSERSFVIDSGFTEEMAVKRGRRFLRCPIDSLALLGLNAETTQDLILTHLHYDHVGNFHRFPVAQFHLQERELTYATGKYMRHAYLAHAYEVEEIIGIVRLNYGRRVTLHDGDVALAPGISLHRAPGHTAGVQYVRVPW